MNNALRRTPEETEMTIADLLTEAINEAKAERARALSAKSAAATDLHYILTAEVQARHAIEVGKVLAADILIEHLEWAIKALVP